MNWDLSEAPGASLRIDPKSKSASWRTSFGSERRSIPRPISGTAIIDADVVLLQGLTSVREARRHFPAREWKLIVSRQILENDDPLNTWTEEMHTEFPATAIAVRYQEGLRVTGQDHLLSLSAPGAQLEKNQPATAGTAVRLSSRAQSIWVLSLELTAECIEAGAVCPASQRIANWKVEHSREAAIVVTGGRQHSPPSSLLPPPPCDGRTLELDGPKNASTLTKSTTNPNPDWGCILRMDLKF